MNRIRDWLYIGDIQDARERRIPTDVAVTVCQDNIEDNVGCSYHHFNMSDGEAKGYGGECTPDIFNRAVDTVVNEVENGNTVFVHCHAGQSRSSAVCITALAHVDELAYDEAFSIVQDARPIINPNRELALYARQYLGDEMYK